MWEALVGFKVDGKKASTDASRKVIGKRFDTDGADPHVLQCRTGGFTFSRLSPYVEWGALRADALRLWEAFYKAVQPQTITRLAVRYINEIKIPLPIEKFGDYLVCPPQAPDSLPQALSGFMQRVIIPDEKTNSISIVNQLFEGNSEISDGKEVITVVLDIDVFRQVSIDTSRANDIFAVLDVLREQKNKMFFEHLTEQAVEMFQ